MSEPTRGEVGNRRISAQRGKICMIDDAPVLTPMKAMWPAVDCVGEPASRALAVSAGLSGLLPVIEHSPQTLVDGCAEGTATRCWGSRPASTSRTERPVAASTSYPALPVY